MKFLLSVIAVCLVMITAKLYIPEAKAEVAGMDSYDLQTDYDFKRAVQRIIQDQTNQKFIKIDEELAEIDEVMIQYKDEITHLFRIFPDNIREMINTQCTVSGRAIYCPLKDRKNLVN